MRAKKAKALRNMYKKFFAKDWPGGQLLGDRRTVRRYFKITEHVMIGPISHETTRIIKTGPNGLDKSFEGLNPEELCQTFTLTRQTNDPRRLYKRQKRVT